VKSEKLGSGVKMGFYEKMSFRLFSQFSEDISEYFGDLKSNLRKSKNKLSLQEYLSITIMSCFLVFAVSFPILSIVLGLLLQTFLFGFITSLTISIVVTVMTFFLFTMYPKITIGEKAKHIDNALPFAVLYISTVASSKLPLHKVFNIFTKFGEYGELSKEVKSINDDMEFFGVDVNTALDHAIDRSPSKSFKEMLWGLMSTLKSGGDITEYLRVVSVNMMAEYRRKLYEFSNQLAIFIEVYLTAIVLGVMFFIILTSILSGISQNSDSSQIVIIQFLLIFAFMPLVSAMFIILIKSITPGED
jgi:archaeal flagellar protein FlaJ